MKELFQVFASLYSGGSFWISFYSEFVLLSSLPESATYHYNMLAVSVILLSIYFAFIVGFL